MYAMEDELTNDTYERDVYLQMEMSTNGNRQWLTDCALY